MKVIPEYKAQKQINLLTNYIEDGTCEEQEWGLCDNVLLNDFDKNCWREWPSFLGGCSFPIEGSHKEYGSQDARLNRHNRSHKYGILRLELAEFCLKAVLEQVNGGEEA